MSSHRLLCHLGPREYTKDEPGRLGFAHLNVTKDWDITLWWVLPQGLRWLLSSHCGLRVMVRSPNPAPPGLEKKQKPGRWDFSGPIPTLSVFSLPAERKAPLLLRNPYAPLSPQVTNHSARLSNRDWLKRDVKLCKWTEKTDLFKKNRRTREHPPASL